MFIKNTKIKAYPIIGEETGKHITCFLPYNETEMMCRKASKQWKHGHIQTIRKDKLVEEPKGVTEFYH